MSRERFPERETDAQLLEENARLMRELEDANATLRDLLDEAAVRNEDFHAAVEHQRNLLNSLAHEVRGPLTSCDLLLDELLSEYDLGEAESENLHDARQCVAEAVRLVKEQLQRARLEAGVTKPRLDTVTVDELYLALRGMVRALRPSEEISLEFHAQDDLPPLHTDPHMLGQILRNLVGNALKFTPAGCVTVSARFEKDPDAFVFEVSDDGIGIAEEDRERVFEDFGQVRRPQTEGHRGTGLGLPLSRSLAEALGGTLELEPSAESGATFLVRLPAAPGIVLT